MSKLVWNKLATPGAFKGHPSGPFAMNGETFAQIEKNFQRDGIKVPFDYEHASEVPVSQSDAKAKGDAKAAGWIHQLQAKPDGLYGLVEWLPDARQKIKAGEFKYISPAIRFGAIDGKTGEKIGAKLTSAALVLKPFLKDLPEVQAADGVTAFLCSEVSAADVELGEAGKSFIYSANEYLPQLRNRMGMDSLASPKEMRARVGRLMDLCDMADGDPTATVEGIPLINYMAPLRDYMRMPPNTSLSDMLCAVAEMLEAAMPEDDGDEDPEGAEMADVPPEPATEPASPAPAPIVEVTEMSDKTITLADHEAKVAEAVKSATETTSAALTLKLNAADSKIVELNTALEEANGRIKALSDEIEASKAKAREDRVTEAFETYKTARKLSDSDRKAMAVVLSSDAALFEELYPRQSVERRPLLQNLSVPGAGAQPAKPPVYAGAIPTRGAAVSVTMAAVTSLNDLIEKFKSENPNKSFDDVFSMAHKEYSKLLAAV